MNFLLIKYELMSVRVQSRLKERDPEMTLGFSGLLIIAQRALLIFRGYGVANIAAAFFRPASTSGWKWMWAASRVEAIRSTDSFTEVSSMPSTGCLRIRSVIADRPQIPKVDWPDRRLVFILTRSAYDRVLSPPTQQHHILRQVRPPQ
jgi:hypothetical protein